MVKAVIEIEEERRALPQLAHTCRQRSRRIRNVVKDTKRISEILRVVGQWNRIDGLSVEEDVGHARKTAASDLNRVFGGVDAMKLTHARRDLGGPSPRSATEVEPFRRWLEFVPRKDVEIALEKLSMFLRAQLALVKCRPFLTEAANDGLIAVFG